MTLTAIVDAIERHARTHPEIAGLAHAIALLARWDRKRERADVDVREFCLRMACKCGAIPGVARVEFGDRADERKPPL